VRRNDAAIFVADREPKNLSVKKKHPLIMKLYSLFQALIELNNRRILFNRLTFQSLFRYKWKPCSIFNEHTFG